MDAYSLLPLFFFLLMIPVLLLVYRRLTVQTAKYDVESTGRIVGRKPNGRFGGTYYVQLEYVYQGHAYREFTRYAVGPGPWNGDLAEGAVIRIYINSRDPSDVYCGRRISGMGGKTK